MKKCRSCGHIASDDSVRFCPVCGNECETVAGNGLSDGDGNDGSSPLMGDKNLLNNSSVIGKQEKYEASNITIHNNISEDHSHVTVVCAVSGKRIYMDQSIVCPQCGQPVAKEYYVEASKRCENCEKAAREEFRGLAAGAAGNGPFDVEKKRQLDREAARLGLSESVAADILRSAQKKRHSDNNVLTPVQQTELKSAVNRMMQCLGLEEDVMKKVCDSLTVLHESVNNDIVDCWYYLALAVSHPEDYVAKYEESLTDAYWMRYWGFVAYTNCNSPKAGRAVDTLSSMFGDREDDVKLAETAFYISKWFSDFEQSVLEQVGEKLSSVHREYLSQPLTILYDTMKRVSAEGVNHDSKYKAEELFMLVHVLNAGDYINRLYDARIANEKSSSKPEERREASSNSNKPAKPDSAKTFAGYDTEKIPHLHDKNRWGKRILIIVIVLIAILIALFLIPAPEWMLND